MKLGITVRATDYSTTFEAVDNDPDNAGMSYEGKLWLQGWNQSAGYVEVEVNEEFEVGKEEEGTIDGFVDDPTSLTSVTEDRQLEGDYKIGDTLQPGTYYFDRARVVGPQRRRH